MPDMLVKLYELPNISAQLANFRDQRIEIRRALPADGPVLTAWIHEHFSESWAIGCAAALTQRPITCFLAIEHQTHTQPPAHPYDLPAETLIGFACYDVASRGMFGPTGIHTAYRQRGIGTAMLITTLQAMANEGYMYAIIGWVGPSEFYTKAVDAMLIPNSEPAGFRGPLRTD